MRMGPGHRFLLVWLLAAALAVGCRERSAPRALRMPEQIQCGSRTCDPRSTYCEIVLSDAPELPSDYTCRPLPPACASPEHRARAGCGCLPPRTRCMHFCSLVDTQGGPGLRLTCVGGA
jgi:hypothetical protein